MSYHSFTLDHFYGYYLITLNLKIPRKINNKSQNSRIKKFHHFSSSYFGELNFGHEKYTNNFTFNIFLQRDLFSTNYALFSLTSATIKRFKLKNKNTKICENKLSAINHEIQDRTRKHWVGCGFDFDRPLAASCESLSLWLSMVKPRVLT